VLNEDKLWRCKGCRATLGRVKRNRNGVLVLSVYRNPDEPEHVASESSGFQRVYCGKCGAVRAWFPERGR